MGAAAPAPLVMYSWSCHWCVLVSREMSSWVLDWETAGTWGDVGVTEDASAVPCTCGQALL